MAGESVVLIKSIEDLGDRTRLNVTFPKEHVVQAVTDLLALGCTITVYKSMSVATEEGKAKAAENRKWQQVFLKAAQTAFKSGKSVQECLPADFPPEQLAKLQA